VTAEASSQFALAPTHSQRETEFFAATLRKEQRVEKKPQPLVRPSLRKAILAPLESKRRAPAADGKQQRKIATNLRMGIER
jgi:hypothetical protein